MRKRKLLGIKASKGIKEGADNLPGYTKNLCQKELTETKKDIDGFLKSIEAILPYKYSSDTIIELISKYYPYELFLFEEKFNYYCAKEKSLTNKGKKSRYNYEHPLKLVKGAPRFKKFLSEEYISRHRETFDRTSYSKLVEEFKVLRKNKIEKIFDKIQKAKVKTQQIEPKYLDVLMGYYDRKKANQKDKVYILKELQKYYCYKVLNFFSKKVDTEYNRQLREMSFYHLQSLGFQPKLRRQKYMRIPSKNKKRRAFLKNVYANEKFDIKGIPQELEYRIENAKEQKIKVYDFFLSHSSRDHKVVQELINHLNKKGYNIYCDWINDNDYLKRNLVGEATQKIILKRLKQAKELIFVVSENSMNSPWCKYELNDFYNQKKIIYCLNKEDIERGEFKYLKYKDEWFIDTEYNKMQLY